MDLGIERATILLVLAPVPVRVAFARIPEAVPIEILLLVAGNAGPVHGKET
jgi:hypothetical protein